MKKAILTTCMVLLTSGSALGNLPSWLGNVGISPANPTSSDIVTITLSGEWGDTCYPNDSNISVTDNDVHFDVVRVYPGFYCLFICCFPWLQIQSVGPLPSGTYTIHAGVVDCDSSFGAPQCVPLLPHVPVAEFTVTTTYYVDAADGNDSNDGLTPETAFATIQKGIDTALDGDTVIVQPGQYLDPDPHGEDNVDFKGKNIALTSTDPKNPETVENTVIRGRMTIPSVQFRGTESPDCTLTGFKIEGAIFGYDESVDPEGENHTHATISHCVLQGNLLACGVAVCACDGTISNCLIADNGTNGACLIASVVECHGLMKNCTVVNNEAGIMIGSLGAGGASTIQDCIIYNNRDFQVVLRADATLNISYCDVQGGLEGIYPDELVNWGPGNIDADPCFARMGYWAESFELVEGDYHLQSAAGRWDPNSQSWVIDSNTSLCIDAGNPGCQPGDEPDPNGNRVNMGACGGTAQASKSPGNWAFLADLTNDRKVDANDLRVLGDYWLEAGQCLPGDLDRSQSVDLIDYAIFALQCTGIPIAEPSMTYEIGNCDFTATASTAAEPNFSVWVEGRYIHFEDMMYANCCPDELRLENQIIGNQITLYEIGYDGLCDCMCWFPITATLGPFPDGTYTVEVIDNLGQSLGVVEVTVGAPPEPGISYQIEDCNMEAGASSLAEQSESTRFTVTVEGQYIHFEDIMVANCCADELELEMTVEGNVITIHEIEHTTIFCLCICDFPVTATLGPFESGAYTVEVYEDYGGFIGSTTVTIGPGP
ncbi:MAG: right-handed parallel beta-helix repeat-containing protein [Planctomycetota bacterium]